MDNRGGVEVIAWMVKRSGKLIAWTCFEPGPEYALAALHDLSLADARRQMPEYCCMGYEFVEVAITETGKVWSDDDAANAA
jgi:hypothetical protein